MKSQLSYTDFLDTITEGIIALLPDTYSVSLHQVVKNNNVTLDGLRIREGDEKIFPSIYLNDHYTDYCNGRAVDTIRNDIWTQYLDAKSRDVFCIDIAYILEHASEKLIAKLVNYETNKHLLEDIPHVRIGDLAVTYHLFVSEKNNCLASIRLTNENIANTKIHPAQLFETAIRNTAALFPPIIKRMEDILSEAFGANDIAGTRVSQAPDMYVLTNRQSMNGALCLLYDGLLDSLADKLGTDFYILPSSIHEVILVPEAEGLNMNSLSDLVKEVNLTQVPVEDFLSDHAYLYSELKADIANSCRMQQQELFV